MKILRFLFFCMSSCLYAYSLSEIKEEFSLPLLNPAVKERKTAKISLSNGLQAYLISDPKAEQSAASLAVQVGSWSNPQEFPGMAHFLEHMLFQGTKKYPEENAFIQFILNHGGQFNAFTGEDRTVYFCSFDSSCFAEALDRFSHFFIDPLFNFSCIHKELHAVDQEFLKAKESDLYRAYQISCETSNPNHPIYQFSCGNSDSLKKIDSSSMKKWFEESYSANLMRLVVYSSLDLEELKQQVELCFSSVPNRSLEVLKPSFCISSSESLNTITYIEPIQNIKKLRLEWELPKEYVEDLTKPFELIAYTLNRGQKQSLLEALKQQDLITESIAYVEKEGSSHLFFRIDLTLTEKGVEEHSKVVQTVFSAFQSLKEQGIPSYLQEEKEQLATLNYQYQSHKDPFSFVMKHGSHILDEPLSSYPKQLFFAQSYDATKVKNALQELIPQDFRIYLIAPSTLTKVVPKKQEKWLGGKYTVQPIASALLKKWQNAEINEAIRIPPPNPFVPLSLEVLPISCSEEPSLCLDNPYGKIYYYGDAIYKNPEVAYFFHILTPELTTDTKSQVLADIFLHHVDKKLTSTLLCAHEAGLSCHLSFDRLRFQIELSGFSEKAPLLLEKVFQQLKEKPPTAEEFATIREILLADYENAQKELAFHQGYRSLQSFFRVDKSTSEEKRKALYTISYEEVCSFAENLFQKAYLEGFLSGNLTEKEAESLWVDIHHILTFQPYPKEEHPSLSPTLLKEGPFFSTKKTENEGGGNATLLLIEGEEKTPENEAAMSVLSPLLQETFFHALRTQQKTGYIAKAWEVSWENTTYQIFGVQSGSHEPLDLLFRFELYLEELLENFSQTVSEARFTSLKEASLHKYEHPHRNLFQAGQLYDRMAFLYEGDFATIEKRKKALENLTYDAFYAFCQKLLSRKNSKRFALLIEGKSPFVYQPILPEEVSKITYLKLPKVVPAL